MRCWRVTIAAVAALLACPASQAPGQPARSTTPTGPVLRLGALLPLNGAGAWFGAEIKAGLELAVAERDPASTRDATGVASGPRDLPPPPERETRELPTAASAAPGHRAESGDKSDAPSTGAHARVPAAGPSGETGAGP